MTAATPAVPDPDVAAAATRAGAVDQALVQRLLDGPVTGLLTAEELADAAGVPVAVIEAIAREGLLAAVHGEAEAARFRPSDAGAVRAGVAMLEAGIPLGDLLDLARDSDDALRGVARRAVDLFLAFVRDPAVASELSGDVDVAVEDAREAFDTMLPAATDLVASHLGRLIVEEARLRLAGDATATP